MHIKSVDITTVEGTDITAHVEGQVMIIDTLGQEFELYFVLNGEYLPQIDIVADGEGQLVFNDTFLPEDAPDSSLGYVVADFSRGGEYGYHWTERAGAGLFLSEADFDALERGLVVILKGRLEAAERASREAFKAAMGFRTAV